ncbi:probable inactive histone-lysine N-methyltransferase SUVR2 isoform X2 [Mangifera indica]|uniref:probable inactive histone-lysine N-methyltransferase SUVR2 isoform X2 n=1 Tax=Mangifera indica TaxID=29780 RepID=UPI001CFA8454|nr:probable inactive histone-lysine N-methyltransferase SUVR2 isoform X2 [Mangifera indica]
MAPDPRVLKAFKAMKAIGISENKAKPVLKKLLKLYERNWELIEEENYRALADAIFEEEDAMVSEQKKTKIVDQEENFEDEPLADVEPLRPLKRLRRGQEVPATPSVSNSSPVSGGVLLKRPKLEEGELPSTSMQQQSQEKIKAIQPSTGSVKTDTLGLTYKGKEPLLPMVASAGNRCISEQASHGVNIRDPAVEGNVLSPKKVSNCQPLIKPKDEPFTDDTPQYEFPIAMIHPDSLDLRNSSDGNVSMCEPVGQELHPSQHVGGESRSSEDLPSLTERRSNCQLANVPEGSHPSLEISSTTMGEVKISLSCNPAVGSPNFHMPTLDELRELMELRCLRSYKIIDPSFSFMNLMKDVCECFLELATNSSHESQGKVTVMQPLDQLRKSTAGDALLFGGSKENMYISSSMNGAAERDKKQELKDSAFSNSSSLVVVPQCQLNADELRILHDVKDIAKGEEGVAIPWINEINNECLPPFHYISHNLIFQNARVNVSLYRIGDENCCSSCFGDCLSSAVACACTYQSENFVYTSEGLLKEEFLDEWISMTRDPQQQCLLTCGYCPLERSRNESIIEPCKGHLKRNIIKECWSKCGCYRQCGNRVVQRGINCKLQVFFTPNGKGWGLRTLEKLPKGAFVCEFVGEIITITELYERNSQSHNCPVLLDAYWASGGVPKDEEALCLDATCYGNVARFLNHRCFDANLIEIPVEIESPEHHYYHLAFFTTRDVDAFEELTWDYGIDFDDHDHLANAFRCRCGSKFCRNMKRSYRSKSMLNTR